MQLMNSSEKKFTSDLQFPNMFQVGTQYYLKNL